MILKRRTTPRLLLIPLVALVFLFGVTLPSFLRSTATATATETSGEGGGRRQAHSGEQPNTPARPRAAYVPMAIVAQASTTRTAATGARDRARPDSLTSPPRIAVRPDDQRALHKARSLSYVSHYQREAKGRFKSACTYRVWLKKPNFFRMETQSLSGKQGGILIGDGSTLWIHWPNGRPRWEFVPESAADQKTRFRSYMTKPAPLARHSIWHEVRFLGYGMSFPILEASTFHGYVDSIEGNLSAVRGLGSETIAGEVCDQIEVSLIDGQRVWWLWLSKRDHVPRKLKEIVHVSDDIVTNEEWSSVAIDAEIPARLFAWKPPAGWTQWKLPDEEDFLLKPGSKAPDFELTSLDGGRIRLSDYRGKCVWLCFWRVGCPGCIENMPHLQRVYQKYKDQGLVILGIDAADDRAITVDYVRKQGITFPNILDTSPAGEKVSYQDYGGGVPMYYLIGADGIIVDAWYGASGKSHQREKAALRKIRPEWAEAAP